MHERTDTDAETLYEKMTGLADNVIKNRDHLSFLNGLFCRISYKKRQPVDFVRRIDIVWSQFCRL